MNSVIWGARGSGVLRVHRRPPAGTDRRRRQAQQDAQDDRHPVAPAQVAVEHQEGGSRGRPVGLLLEVASIVFGRGMRSFIA